MRNRPPDVDTSTRGRAVTPSSSPRRTHSVPTVPLPAEIRTALSGIAAALRDVPRDCIIDMAELFHWLRRFARRVDEIRDKPVPAPTTARTSPAAPSPTSVLSSPPRALSARERAEAAFRGAGDPSTPMSGVASPVPSPQAVAEAMFRPSGTALPRPRIILSRKGRQVRIDVAARNRNVADAQSRVISDAH